VRLRAERGLFELLTGEVRHLMGRYSGTDAGDKGLRRPVRRQTGLRSAVGGFTRPGEIRQGIRQRPRYSKIGKPRS
jgi:hypothetical protein